MKGRKLEPGLAASFEDPADFLEVIKPARVRILKEIDGRVAAIADSMGAHCPLCLPKPQKFPLQPRQARRWAELDIESHSGFVACRIAVAHQVCERRRRRSKTKVWRRL